MTLAKEIGCVRGSELWFSTERRGEVNRANEGPASVIAVTSQIGMFQVIVPRVWGEPFGQANVKEALGEGINHRDVLGRLENNWWKSQAVRFFLRWETAYLCHLVNFARHQTYGMEVALDVIHKMGGHRAPTNQNKDVSSAAGSLLAQRAQHCSSSLNSEPFLPRPIIRVHVRGSDKVREMQLLSLEQHLDRAQQLTSHPSLRAAKNIWLSSEDQKTFDEAKNMTSWKPYILHMDRKIQRGEVPGDDQWEFVQKYGVRDYMEASLANLLISLQSDGFVLALQSNWDRLANELRVTSGRLRYPINVVNQGEY